MVLPLLSACWAAPQVARAEADKQVKADKPNLLMVVVDTLRADRLGCYGYDRNTTPNIDSLAERGVQFQRCYSTSSWTLPAVASLLSGTYPGLHGAVEWTDRVDPRVPWLPAALKQNGFQTLAVTANPFLTQKHGFDRGFERFDDETVIRSAQWSFPRLESQFKALVLASTSATTTRRAMELLNEWDQERPFFMMVHYMDPHADYVPPEPYDTRFGADYEGPYSGHVQSKELGADLPKRAVEHIKGLYDGEVAHVDEHVGRLLKHLEALEVRDKTVVIITADHGEGLLDHGRWVHGRTLYEEVVRVPLVIDWPGVTVEPAAIEQPMSLVDVAPTVLETLGMAVPQAVQGYSHKRALKEGQPKDREPVLFSTSLGSKLVGAVDGADKMIARRRSTVGETEAGLFQQEYYDLKKDPREQDPQADADMEALEAFLGQSLDQIVPAPNVGKESGAGQEQRHRERLRSLGYGGKQGDKP